MADRKTKIIAVLPAYNAEKTLEKTLADIPRADIDEILLVDDASTDNTVALAERLGLPVVRHPSNRGYGGNQKTCYREALRRGADIVVMIHPDYQYDARLTPLLTGFIERGVCDVMFGSRIRTRAEALRGGMPAYKYFFNRALTALENLVLGQNLGETHSGFRAYSRRVLETLPWERNSDDFVFDQQFIVQSVHFGFRLGDVPVPTRYERSSSSIGFRRSVIYGLGTLWVLCRWVLHRWRLVPCPLFVPKPS
ncbi:MAG TPA: glycosyltransferase family 2 protein [Elusimicrobiota bacterium]|jgi:glycosyltransferase involved in cell wall biosynthesis|nr:glycosyltransferase family 2 protein [Elusimicrobiota bacterium]HMX42740.1 glycosyltransferase family 2 protein [Elusimicrobiota bacterium]HMX94048.1 glycosyltransferase family 2 protein [Elusimicrobiota bacterium]HMZ25704.1 glycosyltransferase family 2 protein [Elusimicrobiota bacterium]HNA60901.1 glycosyltransferase family 2 protein [Elusimicrobiota bacterium]